jgi:hypothetical protein
MQISNIISGDRRNFLHKLTLLGASAVCFLTVKAQSGRFYANTYSQAVFAQIDGDQASGYNKLGYSIGATTGIRLQDKKISALEFHIGIAERGSRRPPNIDDPGINPFHIRYQAFEAGFGVVIPMNSLPLPQLLQVYAGVRPYLLFNVVDTEAFMPSIDQDMRPFGVLLEAGARYPIHAKWLISLSAFYGATSISKGSSNASIYYPMGNGAYHNNFAIGFIYKPNNRK